LLTGVGVGVGAGDGVDVPEGKEVMAPNTSSTENCSITPFFQSKVTNEAKDAHASPYNKRIPQGTVFGEIELEAAKAFPIKLWQGTGLEPRIAYADCNTHKERNFLSVKLLPEGAKTAQHPQIVFFIKGAYHVEPLSYFKSNAWDWTTWQEFHVDAKQLKHLIDAVIKAEIALEAL
jgi:hypothetical protein